MRCASWSVGHSWTFVDKLFALGYATGAPFKDLYHNIAGDAWADWLFMAGLLGIGVALTLGAWERRPLVQRFPIVK